MNRAPSFLCVFLAAWLVALSARAGVDQGSINTLLGIVGGLVKSQQVATMSEADEIAAGKGIAAGALASYPVVHDNRLQRYLNRVGMWVALQSSRPALPWRFAAVDSPQINAFAVPGGTVLVTSGMLSLVTNEAELACVLGHEIGHVSRKHHLALLQKQLLLNAGASTLSTQLRSSETKQFLVAQGNELFSRSLDRDSERDADSDGVVLAARAGYDPRACQDFIQRMAELKQDGGTLASLYKTHPRPTERVNDVTDAIARLEGATAGSGITPKLDYRK